ncbi:bola protein [Phakopsora pachyrhizi]|uniref:Bola protein n=1 Tax=Phakopsora pachyrhizi TaxID=170000 RepID=A0AAV0BSP6_PHAPC|nr:bola protein [Phakopsora pachyrhizi]CAH7690110.1 bola protein [Phakopsora pachyrhizi]
MTISESFLQEKLLKSFPGATFTDVQDISGGCGQSYKVLIVSVEFEGKKLLEKHRLVNDRLKDEISQLHAFSQETFTPEQYEVWKSKNQNQL